MSETIQTPTDSGVSGAPPIPPGATPPLASPEPAGGDAGGQPPAPAETPSFDAKAASKPFWKAMPEELRGYYENKGFTEDTFDAVEVFKQRREVERLVGRKGVPLPEGDGDEAGWAAFHKALGVPDDPSGYGIKSDDPAMKEQAEAVAKVYHEAKLTPKQADALTQATIALQQQQQQQAEAAAANAKAEREETVRRETAELQQEWGVEWDRKDQAAGRAISNLGLEEAALQAITEKVGYKKMMQTFAAIGESASEAAFHGISGNTPSPQVSSAAGARAKIAELRGDPAFQERIRSTHRDTQQAALREWENLHKMAYPTG